MITNTFAKSEKYMNGKVGRPCKFYNLNLRQVRIVAEKGFTDLEMCDLFDVSERAWNNWKKKFPEFMQSLKRWKSVANKKAETALYELAIGYRYLEIKPVLLRGEVTFIEVVKQLPPNTTACIFWLKNRMPQEWR